MMMEYKKLNGARNDFAITMGIVSLFFAFSFGTAIYGVLKGNQLENELETLRIKYKFLQNSIVELGLKENDYEDYDPIPFDYDDDEKITFPTSDPEDEFDYDDKNKDNVYTSVLVNAGLLTKDGLERARKKRDVLATTADGILVNSESYADIKTKNKTAGKSLKLYPLLMAKRMAAIPLDNNKDEYNSPTYLDNSPNQLPTKPGKQYEEKPTPGPSPILARKSRVMHFEDKSKAFRRVVKRPVLRSADSNYGDQVTPRGSAVNVPHRRRHRQRRVDSFGERRFARARPSIHLNGEVIQSTYGMQENFLGNGRLHHYNRHFINWTRDDWVKNLGMDQFFEVNDGYLTFLDAGLYMVYAQIFYVDEHDTNGFRVYKNEKMILQCTTTSHTNHRVDKPNTCYTAGVEYFREGDSLRVHDIEANRYSIFEPGKSFFGAIKLGDGKMK